MELKPGSILTIVLENYPPTEVIDLRSSNVYAVIGKKLIIAQSDPFIPKNLLKKTITISSLTREKGEPVRYGLKAEILEFIDDYPLASSQKVPALIVNPKSPLEPFNLRASYRISPPYDCGLDLSLASRSLNLLNISIGGGAFSHRYDFRLLQGMVIKLTLTIDNQDFEAESTIKRISFPGEQHWSKGLEFVSVEFNKLGLETRHLLGRKILNIQRELRSKELNL